MLRSTHLFQISVLSFFLFSSSAYAQLINAPLSELILQDLNAESRKGELSAPPALQNIEGRISNMVNPDLIPEAPECFPKESRLDLENDGRVDAVVRRHYDEDGLLRDEVFRFHHLMADTPNRIRLTQYNQDGFATMEVTRIAPSGQESGAASTEHTRLMQRDISGALIEESLDLHSDGEREKITYFEYDRRGIETVEAVDQDGDGIVDLERVTRVFHLEREIEITLRETDQREPFKTVLIGLDEEDRPVTVEMDVDGDNIMDTLQINTYDDGLLIGSWSRNETDRETLIIYGYDALGNQVLMAKDDGNDGIMDEVLETDFSCL